MTKIIRLIGSISPKNLMLYGMLGQLISGLSLAFLDDYKWQLAMRFLNSVACAQMFAAGQMIREYRVGYITAATTTNHRMNDKNNFSLQIVSDIISPRYLKTIMPLFDTFWSIGEILLAAITYFVHTWKDIYLTISLPTIAYIILWYFVADSPRWHIKKGNITLATKIILNAAETNNKSRILHGNFIAGLSADHFAPRTSPSDAGLLSLWKFNRNFVNIVFIHLIWGTVLTNFNGMLLNTRNFGAETLHRNVALTGIVLAVFLYSKV